MVRSARKIILLIFAVFLFPLLVFSKSLKTSSESFPAHTQTSRKQRFGSLISHSGTLIVVVKEIKTKKPIQNAKVQIQNSNLIFARKTAYTNSKGTVLFSHLLPGEYKITASWGKETVYQKKEVVAAKISTILFSFSKLGETPFVEVIATKPKPHPPIPTKGAVTKLGTQFLKTQITQTSKLTSILAAAPGVATESTGQIHIEGEHRALTYMLDGVPLPLTPESQANPFIDPRFLSSISIQTGDFKASGVEKLGGILSLVPLTAANSIQGEIEPSFGSFGTTDVLGYLDGKTSNSGWEYFIGSATRHSDLFSDPVNPYQQTLNNYGTQSSGFMHLVHKSKNGWMALDFGENGNAFAIPNTPLAQAAGVLQTENDENLFGVFSLKRDLSQHLALHFGYSYLNSTQTVQNNGKFTPFIQAVNMPNVYLNGLPENPEDPGAPILPYANDQNIENLLTLTFDQQLSQNNRLSWGGLVNFMHINNYWNFVDAGGSGSLPNEIGPTICYCPGTAYISQDIRSGFHGDAFVNDSMTFGSKVGLDLGMRWDYYNNGVNISTAQGSPFINFSYALTPTQTLYLSFDHLYNVPPLELDIKGGLLVYPENVNDYQLDYKLKPSKRISIEVGGYIKKFVNQLDIGLLLPFTNIPIYAPDNFPLAEANGLELTARSENITGINWFMNYLFSLAKNLSPGAGNFIYFPLYDDQDQRHTLTFGVSYNLPNGFYASVYNQYGSGYPQKVSAIYAEYGVYPFGLNGYRESHFITNLNIGWKPFSKNSHSPLDASFEVLNLFNSNRNIDFLSDFSGTRYIAAREFILNLYRKF